MGQEDGSFVIHGAGNVTVDREKQSQWIGICNMLIGKEKIRNFKTDGLELTFSNPFT